MTKKKEKTRGSKKDVSKLLRKIRKFYYELFLVQHVSTVGVQITVPNKVLPALILREDRSYESFAEDCAIYHEHLLSMYDNRKPKVLLLSRAMFRRIEKRNSW
jgi:hypothetical protein